MTEPTMPVEPDTDPAVDDDEPADAPTSVDTDGPAAAAGESQDSEVE